MFCDFKVFDIADAGSILQIEPKRFDSGYKPEPTKKALTNKACPCRHAGWQKPNRMPLYSIKTEYYKISTVF